MQKSAHLLIFFLGFFLLNPAMGLSVSKSASSPKSTILTSNHKFSPVGNQLTEVRRQIKSSSQPVREKYPMLLDRAADIKRKPVKLVKISDRSFRRRLSARSAIVLDARTGREIYSHDPDRPGQPASTIKVLTSLVAMDSLKNNALVPVSSWAAGMPRSKIYIKKGKAYYADDLINAVLLASANDASVALAEKVAGSETGFAKMMTRKATELGARKTICKTASGLTAKGQQTTARDLAVIFREAMKNPEFAGRMKLIKAKTSYGKTLKSHNKALWQINGALGGKTGYTRAAKQTYVGKFSRNGEELLVAILGSRNMWSDIAKLVEYGFTKKQQLRLADRAGSGTKSIGQPSPLRSSAIVLSENKKTKNL